LYIDLQIVSVNWNPAVEGALSIPQVRQEWRDHCLFHR